MKQTQILVVSFILALITSCQSMYVPTARDVKRKPKTGGIVAMPTNFRPEDRARADELMRQNCGSDEVEIVDEGEVIVGQSTQSNASETHRDDTRTNQGKFLGLNVISGTNSGAETQKSSVTTNLNEWQISYTCVAASKSKRKETK